jgi:hypothetical protein
MGYSGLDLGEWAIDAAAVISQFEQAAKDLKASSACWKTFPVQRHPRASSAQRCGVSPACSTPEDLDVDFSRVPEMPAVSTAKSAPCPGGHLGRVGYVCSAEVAVRSSSQHQHRQQLKVDRVGRRRR